MSNQKYQCIREWKRHRKGQVIIHWEWAKLPQEIQQKHFEPIVEAASHYSKPAVDEKIREVNVKKQFKFNAEEENDI